MISALQFAIGRSLNDLLIVQYTVQYAKISFPLLFYSPL